MRGRLLSAALATALWVGAGGAPALDLDLSQNDVLPDPLDVSADTFLYQSLDSQGSGNSGKSVSVAGGASLIVGQDRFGAGYGFSLAVADLAVGSGSAAVITAASQTSASNGYDVTVEARSVDIDTGASLTLSPSGSGEARLTVADSMTVRGILGNTGDATIGFGQGRSGTMVIDGGTVFTNGGDLAIANARIELRGDASELSAFDGVLDLSSSALHVVTAAPGDRVSLVADSNILAGSYTQSSGTASVSQGWGSGQLIVTEKAVIGMAGAADPVVFSVDSDAALFQGGLVLGENGVLHSGSSTGRIAFGDGSGRADVDMTGGALLDGDAALGTLTLARNGTSEVRLRVSGTDNRVVGEVEAGDLDLVVKAAGDGTALTISEGASLESFTVKSATVEKGTLALGEGSFAGRLAASGDVVVKSGGVLAARDTDSFLSGNGSLWVKEGGTLFAESANFHISDFYSVTIDGLLRIGYDPVRDGITGIIVDPAISGGDLANGMAINGAIGLTREAALKVAVGDTLIDMNNSAGVITYRGNPVNTSIFGSYQYGLSDDRQHLEVKAIVNRIAGDGSAADRDRAFRNLGSMWGRQINRDLADILYDASVGNNLTVSPAGNRAGETNLTIFEAIANPAGKRVGRSTLEYVNGAQLYGVTDVALETSRAFFSGIATRARSVRSEFTDVQEVLDMVEEFSSEEALGSAAILSTCQTNRFWAGGFGHWQDADARQGFSGYRYESWGMITGFDRALAPGLAMGASFAYNKGDYADKGAHVHDSTIESYTGGLYGVYSGKSGLNATVFASYGYSDNDIRELRDNPATNSQAWSEARFHTNTWAAGGLFGWDFKPTSRFTVTPSTGIHYLRARNSDHVQSLGGVATQKVTNARNHGVFLPVEVQAGYEFTVADEGKLLLEAGVGYAYNFHESGMDGAIDYFGLVNAGGSVPTAAISSRDNSRHNYKAGLGARLSYKQYDLGIRYDYTGKGSYSAHRAVGSVGISF